jgi:hypothetical protein
VLGLMHSPDGAGPTAVTSSSHAAAAAAAAAAASPLMVASDAVSTTRLRQDNTPEEAREARAAPVAALL